MSTYSSKFRVFQNWGSPEPGTAGQQNVFVFGPRYALHRYTNEDERSEINPVQYTSQEQQQRFDGCVDVPANYSLDEASFDVYAENAFVRVCDAQEGPVECIGNYLDGVLFYPDAYLTETGKPDSEDLSFGAARPVVAGDYVSVRKKDANGKYWFENIRIAAVEITNVKDEYEEYTPTSRTGTVIRLETGLPDDTFGDDGNLLEGVSIFITAKLDGIALAKDSYSFDEDGIVVFNQAFAAFYSASIAGELRALLSADLFTSFRSLCISDTGAIDVATNTVDAEKALGKADPDNPVSMGVFNAFVGGAPVVYYFVTAGDSRTAFSKALAAAELNSTLYYLVPMTQDKSILSDVAAHVDAMSDQDTKRWRMLFCCSPVDSVVETSFTVDDTGIYRKGNKNYLTLKSLKPVPDVSDGDTVKVGDATYTITSRLNSNTLLTRSTSEGTTGDAVLYHVRTSSEFAAASAASAKALGTFRAVDVFPKRYSFDGESYSSMYAAPIIAGIKAAKVPHAPITNDSIPGIDDLPDMYTGGYTTADLDTVAAGGVLVMTQDQKGENVYVRKQLTTGLNSGIKAMSELSMMVNFDYIAAYFNRVIESYKGAYNVTDTLVSMIRVSLRKNLYALLQSDYDQMLGAPVLPGSRVDRVYVDPANASRVIAHVIIVLPAPFNEMDLYLSVSVQAVTEEEEAAQ